MAGSAGLKRVYLAVRALTQVGILSMAAMAASPVLTPLVVHLGLGTGAYRLQLPALAPLSCLTLASFALTSLLRSRYEA